MSTLHSSANIIQIHLKLEIKFLIFLMEVHLYYNNFRKLKIKNIVNLNLSLYKTPFEFINF